MRADPDAPQIRPAAKDMRDLRQAIRVAQEMGKGLGRGALLLAAVPGRPSASPGRQIINFIRQFRRFTRVA
jgi:hypothetical protein